MSRQNNLLVRLSQTDQQAVTCLKSALGAKTTTAAVREAMKLSLAVVAATMKTHNLSSYEEFQQFLNTPDEGVESGSASTNEKEPGEQGAPSQGASAGEPASTTELSNQE